MNSRSTAPFQKGVPKYTERDVVVKQASKQATRVFGEGILKGYRHTVKYTERRASIRIRGEERPLLELVLTLANRNCLMGKEIRKIKQRHTHTHAYPSTVPKVRLLMSFPRNLTTRSQ